MIAKLERRLGQASKNSSRPPSTDPPGSSSTRPAPTDKPAGHKPGGQPGHRATTRKLLASERSLTSRTTGQPSVGRSSGPSPSHRGAPGGARDDRTPASQPELPAMRNGDPCTPARVTVQRVYAEPIMLRPEQTRFRRGGARDRACRSGCHAAQQRCTRPRCAPADGVSP